MNVGFYDLGVLVGRAAMVVHPGDLIVGDDDGLTAIPRAEVASIHELATKKHAAEQKQMEDTKSGTLDRNWVDCALAAASCEFMD